MAQLSRREALKFFASAGAALAFSRSRPTWGAPGMGQGEIHQRPIPSTGEKIPVMGLGTSRTFNVEDDAESWAPLEAVLDEFFSMGGRVLDTAPSYGRSEAMSGMLAARLKLTERLFFATKVGADDREEGLEQLRASQELLGRQTLDLVQIHNLRDWETQLETLRAWKEAGRVRYIGITTHRDEQHAAMAEILEAEEFDFIQLNYSIRSRQAEELLLPLAAEKGIAVLVNRPYERGRLFGIVDDKSLPEWAAELEIYSWGQYFLKFLLGNPTVTCLIPATSKAHHARDNMTAGYGPLPDDVTRKRMVDYLNSL